MKWVTVDRRVGGLGVDKLSVGEPAFDLLAFDLSAFDLLAFDQSSATRYSIHN